MSALVFSELAQLVLQDHQRRAFDNRLMVIPVVCLGYTADSASAEVLHTAIGAEEGESVTASGSVSGVEGELGSLANDIGDLYRNPDDPDQPGLIIAKAGNEIRATFSNGNTPPWSPGEETLVGGMLAPLSARLRRCEIAAISYDESHLDLHSAEALWQYYCLYLPARDLDNLRTLVVLCYAPTLVPARHCQKFNSARFVVSPTKVSRRREWKVDQNEIRRLGREATTPTVLFLAAGFSSSSETSRGPLPLGNELRDRALRRYIDEFDSDQDAATAFRTFCTDRATLLPGEKELSEAEFRQLLTLERVLQVELAETSDPLGPTLTDFAAEVEEAKQAPGQALISLSEMLEQGGRFVLVTVNFDELVEHQCGDLVEPFVDDAEFEAAADYIARYSAGEALPAPLLKLHGTLSKPPSIVATVGSVAKGLATSKAAALRSLLGEAERPRLWFYLGASMRDRDILQHIGVREFAEGSNEWWVAPSRDSSVEKFIRDVRDPVWDDLGLKFDARAKCITTTADIFMGELAEALRQS
ncbi:MAG: SIR2 family protein [Actinomycetota bacterium]|nr:SIR2 family protein [Actinomycetota bacterium]